MILFKTVGSPECQNFRRQNSCQQDSVVLGSPLPPDVEGEGWQGSILQSTRPSMCHATSSMLAESVVLFSVWEDILFLPQGRKK